MEFFNRFDCFRFFYQTTSKWSSYFDRFFFNVPTICLLTFRICISLIVPVNFFLDFIPYLSCYQFHVPSASSASPSLSLGASFFALTAPCRVVNLFMSRAYFHLCLFICDYTGKRKGYCLDT